MRLFSGERPPWGLAGLGLALFVGGLILIVRANLDPTEGPCRSDEALHPTEERCAGPLEVCHAWLRGRATHAASCQVEAPDGRGVLQTQVTGSGFLEIDIRMAQGRAIFGREYNLPQEWQTSVFGPAGDWILEVYFGNATGEGHVTLWG